MPYPLPLRFSVTTQEYEAVAVLEGDLAARNAAVAADRAFVKLLAKTLIGPTSPFRATGSSLWMLSEGRDGGPVEVAVVSPRPRPNEAFGTEPSTIRVAGRAVSVATVDDDGFRRSIPAGAFRFDDFYHLHREYFEGHCHHFALAAKLVTGLPLGVMWDDMAFADEENGIKEITHVYLELPDGKAFDYDGIRMVRELMSSIAGPYVHETSCGPLKVADLKDFIENGWLDDYDDEQLLQALDVIALDPVLSADIESLAPGRLAEVRAAITADLGFEPEGPRPWSWLRDAGPGDGTEASPRPFP